MSTNTRSDSEKKATSALYRKILRFIHEGSYSIGDRLPTHAQLVKELDTCHDTLHIAMKWLAEDGVIQRKQRIGTLVSSLYPENPQHSIWQIGIVVPPLTSSYFVPVLTHFLHKHLARIGAADRIYMIGPHAPPSEEVLERHPCDFPGLEDDIESGLLEALISSTRLVTDKIPVCGANGSAKSLSVNIDHRSFAIEASTILQEAGCRKVLAVTSPPDSGYSNLFIDGIQFANQHCASNAQISLEYATPGVENGHHFANKFLQTEKWKEVDALIIRDDQFAQAVSTILAKSGRTDVVLAVQSNKQIPMSYALRTLNFSLDVDKLASQLVDLLLMKLLMPSSTPQVAPIKPEFSQQQSEIVIHT